MQNKIVSALSNYTMGLIGLAAIIIVLVAMAIYFMLIALVRKIPAKFLPAVVNNYFQSLDRAENDFYYRW